MLTCHIKPAKHQSVSVAIVIMLELLMLAFGTHMCISISSRSCMTIDSLASWEGSVSLTSLSPVLAQILFIWMLLVEANVKLTF